MTDREVVRIAREIGPRRLIGLSFICNPYGPAMVNRLIVYIIAYQIAGLIQTLRGRED